ncbi:MAG: hypothetical protein J2P50_16195 [Hyphomicrobiaceae bacterium]|nr:hypothetical protein [Hyphomicrobiaceae bacterium]
MLPVAAQEGADELEPPLTSSLAPVPARTAPACAEPSIEMAPLRGGRTRIAVDSPCRPQQLVIFTYAGAVFIRSLNELGRAAFILDCFAGDGETVTINFEDHTALVRRPVIGEDMRDFSKVAIVWSSTIDLDLHAFEYSATFGSPGHVWAGRPRSLEEASAERDGRGHGFLSTVGAGGEIGMNMEVHTFVHQRGEAPGVVKLVVDYSTRGGKPEGRFCGGGDLAELPFKAYILDRGGPYRQLELAFASVPCGKEIDAGARFNARLIPDLVIR